MRFDEVLRSTNDFDQHVAVTELADRRPLFIERCAGRSVLYVGCCDVPFFDADTNLHLALAPHTDRLDGLDVSREGIEVLRRHVAGEYFTNASQVTRQYDLLLAPEVIEHTENPFTPEPFAGRQKASALSAEAGLREAETLLRQGNAAAALGSLEATRARFPDSRLLQAEVGLLLGTGQNLEGLRRGVAWLREHPEDAACLLLCADAAEALGDRAMAEQW